jgi:hypothetical protein
MSKNWDPGTEVTAENLNDQGLKVVAQDTPGMTLRVFPGVAIVDGTIVKYLGGNTGTFTAPVTDDRIDIVSIDAAGAINITQGVEDPSPVAPAYLSDETVLCEVYLRGGCTEILNEDDSSEAYLSLDSRPLGAGISLIDETTGAPDAGKGIKTDAEGLLDPSFLRKYSEIILESFENIDGSTTPQAIGMTANGEVFKADADDTRKDRFDGFVKDNFVAMGLAEIVAENSIDGINPSGSVTILAGDNKYILVLQFNAGASGNPAEPSSITWGATNLVKLANIADADRRIVTAWGAVLGNVASDTTNTLTVTGATAPGFNVGSAQWYDIKNVDQSNPIAEAKNSANAASITAMTLNQINQLVITGATSSNNPSTPSGYSSDFASTAGGWNRASAHAYISGEGDFTVAWGGTMGQTDEEATAIIFKNAGPAAEVNVVVDGILDGFSGLTPGATYYLSNTAGAISTSAGGTSIKVGKAISPTQLLIIHPI